MFSQWGWKSEEGAGGVLFQPVWISVCCLACLWAETGCLAACCCWRVGYCSLSTSSAVGSKLMGCSWSFHPSPPSCTVGSSAPSLRSTAHTFLLWQAVSTSYFFWGKGSFWTVCMAHVGPGSVEYCPSQALSKSAVSTTVTPDWQGWMRELARLPNGTWLPLLLIQGISVAPFDLIPVSDLQVFVTSPFHCPFLLIFSCEEGIIHIREI